MEENKYHWILKNRQKGHCVSGSMIKMHELQILHDQLTLAHAHFKPQKDGFIVFISGVNYFLEESPFLVTL